MHRTLTGWRVISLGSMDAIGNSPAEPPFVIFTDEIELNSVDDVTGQPVINWSDGYCARLLAVDAIVENDDGTFSATSIPSHRSVLVRDIQETDSEVTALYKRSLAMPVNEIYAILGGGPMPDALSALVDDEGLVATLMLAGSSGLYVRFSGLWHSVPQGLPAEQDPIDGMTVVDLDDSALELYDAADTAGQVLPITSLPLAPGEDISMLAVQPPEEPAAQTAAATVIMDGVRPDLLQPITCEDEAVEAIAAAAQDPSVRWYVEKRVRALGLDLNLPWMDDADS